MNKLFLLILISFLALTAQSQNQTKLIDSINGKVIWVRSANVDTLVNRIISANANEQKMKGYRVQIYSGNNHLKANKLKAEFMMSYPNDKVYLIYQQPNFKVRIGNYRNQLEALKMYNILQKDQNFRSVLLVPDQIDLPELKKLNE